MINTPSIDKIEGPGDFDKLLAEGISLLQDLSGSIWTDFNEHDPGVTIFENLCYTLTDVLNRINNPIENILTENDGNINLNDYAMYTARDILHMYPVTENDLRKFVIDVSNEIKNAWIEPYKIITDSEEIGVDNLYRVLVDLKVESQEPSIIINTIYEELNKNRNFCEYFPKCGIKKLKIISISASFDLYIDETSTAEEILAEVLINLQDYLRPDIKRYSYSSMQNMGLSTAEIFVGPKLNNGFILTNDLKPRILTIENATLQIVAAKVKGVKSIENFKISGHNEDQTFGDIVFALDIKKCLELIKVYKNQKLYIIENNLVQANINDIVSQNERRFYTKYNPKDLDIPHKKYSPLNVNEYYSIQNDFPKIYGIGTERISNSESTQRKISTLQLKAYLMQFEQLLADIIIQLQEIKNLFSINPQTQSYFYQPLYNVPDAPVLMKGFKFDANDIYDSKQGYNYLNEYNRFINDENNEYLIGLENAYKSIDDFISRRHNFLNHLLARFNYSDIDIPSTLYSSPITEMREYWIVIKELMLKNIQIITSARCKAVLGEQQELNVFNAAFFRSGIIHTISGISYNNVDISLNSNLKQILLTNGTRQISSETHENKCLSFDITSSEFLNNILKGLEINSFKLKKNIIGGNDLLGTTNENEINFGSFKNIGNDKNFDMICSELVEDFQEIFLHMENIFIFDNMALFPDTEKNFFTIFINDQLSSETGGMPYAKCVSLVSESIKQNKTANNQQIVIKNKNQYLSHGFFSFNISVVIPDFFDSIIDTSYNKEYLMGVLTSNLPAHINLIMVQLSQNDFNLFGKYYRDFIFNKTNSKEEIIDLLLQQSVYQSCIINAKR